MIIPVKLGNDSYDIVLERGALKRAGELLRLDRRVFIVTDSGVPAEYARRIADVCTCAHIECIPQGESSKSMEMFRRLLSAMLKFEMGRNDCVVAVGGGVVGDLSGFAAACYMRGIDFYNVPTTLLAQVDSSVGGKTAIDLDGVKNIVGAFYQPKKVLIDPDTLHTLSPRLVHEGLAEAIKMAVTSDAQLLELIAGCESFESIAEKVIERSLRIKAAVVEQDTRENGLRRILNFGHTVGHAVESFNEGRLLHGECVAAGMLPMCSEKLRAQLVPVLEKFSLPHEIKESAAQLLPYMLHDKKKQADKIICVLADEPGKFILRELTAEEICARVEAIK